MIVEKIARRLDPPRLVLQENLDGRQSPVPKRLRSIGFVLLQSFTLVSLLNTARRAGAVGQASGFFQP